jgi:elongation factor P hydroxylase
MAKVKAEQFVDEIFWLDIFSNINLESREYEKVEIKIDDWDWTISKLFIDNKMFEFIITCSNHNNIWHLSKTAYNQKLIKKECGVYLDDIHYDKDIFLTKHTITRNGYQFGDFKIKQRNPRKKD